MKPAHSTLTSFQLDSATANQSQSNTPLDTISLDFESLRDGYEGGSLPGSEASQGLAYDLGISFLVWNLCYCSRLDFGVFGTCACQMGSL
jgi:hypothetical protein